MVDLTIDSILRSLQMLVKSLEFALACDSVFLSSVWDISESKLGLEEHLYLLCLARIFSHCVSI